MARRSSTVTRRETKNKKGPKVAFTRTPDERKIGNSQFLSLNDDEKFVGYALFNPDPEAEDNAGYVEYPEHWDNASGRFIPCWGAKNGCIFCRAGANPSHRALSAFLVTSINGEDLKEPEIKLFRMNWTTMKEWIDTLDEDGETLGQKVRIKCDSRADGDYITKFFEKDRLSKKDTKAALKDVPDLEDLIQKNLNRALDAIRVQDVLESDDDEEDEDIEVEEEDDEEEVKDKKKPSSKKNSKKKVEEEEDEEDEDEEDDDEEDEDDEDEDEKEDDDEEDEDDDEDDEDDEKSDDDEEEDDEEDGEETSIDGTYTVVSTSEAESTFEIKELDSPLYFDEEILEDVDFDGFKKGDKVKIKAERDDDNDWVATKFSKAKKK